MMHSDRDSDLLMLAHGALSPLAALPVRWHLLRCAPCRLRLQQFQSVSSDFASAIRGPQMPPWSPLAMPLTVKLLSLSLVTVCVLIVLLMGTLAVRSFQHSPARPVPITSTPCRPDLPSDRCN